MIGPVHSTAILAIQGEHATARADAVVVEEPLEISITYGPLTNRSRLTVAITLRTPVPPSAPDFTPAPGSRANCSRPDSSGLDSCISSHVAGDASTDDADLAVGYLAAEGLLSDPADVVAVESRERNRVRVDLAPSVVVEAARWTRPGFIRSGCGLCGRTALDALQDALDDAQSMRPWREGATGEWFVTADQIHALPARLQAAQSAFTLTGGLHAAGLFDRTGQPLAVREDVGRHNALDKLLGAAFRAGLWPLHERLVLVSARAGFELVQKAAMAGVPLLAAVGAPSSLAVQAAERLGVTLIGFVRNGRFNIYSSPHRVRLTPHPGSTECPGEPA